MKTFKHKINTSIWLSLCLMIMVFMSCKKDETVRDLGVAPTNDQVKFSSTPTTSNANIINFKNESPGFRALWDFGNGATAEGVNAQASYPLAGTYIVKLTIVTDGGYASSTKSITISNTNPAMLTDPAFTTLSGGLSNTNGKTWIIDQTQPGHLGVGPIASQFPDWYQAGPNEKSSNGCFVLV